MSFARRASTIQEIQKRQRLQPVQCWEQKWVKPANALPGSTYKVLKWVPSGVQQHFSDDEDDLTEHPSATIVVDEELEDTRLASELPDAAAEEGEGDDNDPETGVPPSQSATPAPTSKAVEASDGAKPLLTLTTTETNTPADTPAAPNETSAVDDIADDAVVETSTRVEADPDVLPLGDDMLMPTPIEQIMPEPAPDGPSLGEITQDQLMADAAAFGSEQLLPVDADGIIPDSAMEFAIGEP